MLYLLSQFDSFLFIIKMSLHHNLVLLLPKNPTLSLICFFFPVVLFWHQPERKQSSRTVVVFSRRNLKSAVCSV